MRKRLAVPTFTETQIERYSRQIILPDVGGEGQKKLLSSRVLIVGMGGLGSPAALYLAAAGIGTLGVVDFDTVDLSNLQRQIIHSTEDLGKLKTRSAAETIKAINPDVRVIEHACRLNADNIIEIISPYELIVDGTDNFPSRFLLNDACLLEQKPMVHGAIYRFEGQASTFVAGKGPCYRCLLAEMPPPGMVPRCREAGVFGVLPGIIGAIQAAEAIKLILKIGKPLIGRLLHFTAFEMEMIELELIKDPDCPACSNTHKRGELKDYQVPNECAAPEER